jgi:hypothetical protein
MNRCNLLACAFVAVLALACPMSDSAAQSSDSTGTSQGEVVLTKLFTPVYPVLARQARIAGDVVLKVGIRRDGSVESVKPISGHPLLIQAAEDSARQSNFECRNCANLVTTYQLRYTFQLTIPTSCTLAQCGKTLEEPEQAEESPGHVTISASEKSECSCAVNAHIRSPKCLYLWGCKSLRKPTVTVILQHAN